MPRRKRPSDLDFQIHVDPSCLSAPMDDDTTETMSPGGESTTEQVAPTMGGELEPSSPTEQEGTMMHGDKDKAIAADEGKDQDTNNTDNEDDEEPTQRPEELESLCDATEDETSSLHDHDHDEVEDGSRRSSAISSDRRASGRTEALIHAAARDIVAQIEQHNQRHPEDQQENDEEEGDRSLLSTSSAAPAGDADLGSDEDNDSNIRSGTSRRESAASTSARSEVSRGRNSKPRMQQLAPAAQLHEEAGADSSSNHDDVFSDRSARSSLGSFEGESGHKNPVDEEDHPQQHHQHQRYSIDHDEDETMTQRTYSPRISDISQYEREEFVPTTRGTAPRLPFRTPSAVRALQMSSPPPSVLGSPRSSKRPGLPTISRLGSPNVSAQYSPKGRSTPPRFKPKKEAPLVLLHVTLLPLRWGWGSVLEATATTTSDGAASSAALSDSAKALRDAWRQLADRLGDTVFERGILLPHPQNDYEVLEERLLEALELPLRRRARILECGHYLGPANEFLVDDSEDDDDFETRSSISGGGRLSMASSRSHRTTMTGTHWCTTCRHEIKYESLGGPGKIFRVKVYASNGLMKAGAWEACWREMERVDVEIEPLVEPGLQDELEHLAAEQRERQLREEQEVEEEARRMEEEQRNESRQEEEDHEYADHTPQGLTPLRRRVVSPIDEHHLHPHMMSSPPNPEIRIDDTTLSPGEERRRRDEERLREIYGHTPPPSTAQSHDSPQHHHSHSDYPSTAPQSPERATHHLHDEYGTAHTTRATMGDPSPEPTTTRRHPDSYIPPPSPPSPSAEAFSRREQRRRTYQNMSLPELLIETVKVALQDPKNVVIATLFVAMMLFALRTAPPHPDENFEIIHRDVPRFEPIEEVPGVFGAGGANPGTNGEKVNAPPETQDIETVLAEVVASVAEATKEVSHNPCETPYVGSEGKMARPMAEEPAIPSVQAVREVETVTSKEVVRVVETVTETVRVTATEIEAAHREEQTAVLVEEASERDREL